MCFAVWSGERSFHRRWGGQPITDNSSLAEVGGEVKRKSSAWKMGKTSVRIAGKHEYLFRSVDSHGETIVYLSEMRDREATKLFLRRVIANPTIRRDRCLHATVRGAIRRRVGRRTPRAACRSIVDSELTLIAVTG